MNLRLDETGFGDLKIYQDPEEFCYGVDAVLLAGFAAEGASAAKGRSGAGRIMDLGTGTGIVPLILSHKTDAGYIGGIELQENSFRLAEKNAEINMLGGRLHFFRANVRDFEPGDLAETFDIVTANPPYTRESGGLRSANMAKALARHEIEGNLDDFVKLAAKLLRDKGDFYMVHRPSRLADICSCCRQHHLEPKELQFVSGKPSESPNIVLVHCSRNGNPGLKIGPQGHVHEEDGSYSREILRLYERLQP
ncbi:MAG: tRNA1(Val) (adenine(37)-N6)-methyltransferase [Emergencia sp.]